MSLQKTLGGRRRESCVWDFFEYNETTDKSQCLVVDEKSGKRCNVNLSGKNTTNLINHISRFHKNQHEEFQQKDKQRELTRAGVKRQMSGNVEGRPAKLQSLQEFINRKNISWPKNSSEHMKRLNSLLDMIIHLGLPVTIVDKSSFRYMIATLDPKFSLPGAALTQRLLCNRFTKMRSEVFDILQRARRITLCLDIWTKKNYSGSFLAVSACFYDPINRKATHATLNLFEIAHPHTGEVLADCVEDTLDRWMISEEQILLLITDNGSNMLKACRLLQERYNEKIANTGFDENDEENNEKTLCERELEAEESEDESDGDSDISGDQDQDVHDLGEELVLPQHMSYRRMPCMAHTLQLTIKPVYVHYNTLLTKTRRLVQRIRKSSVAVQALVAKCGKTAVADCTTRWSSTYQMVARLLEIRSAVNEVTAELGIDSLLSSEWQRLADLVKILQPFAKETNTLQTDTCSLSNILPALMNLECHLQQETSNKQLTATLRGELLKRFDSILHPNSPSFNPLPAAATLLDPMVAAALLTSDCYPLLIAAKSYIISLAGDQTLSTPALSTDTPKATSSGLGKFSFLAAKLKSEAVASSSNSSSSSSSDKIDSLASQLNRYINEISDTSEITCTNALEYWNSVEHSYKILAPIAQDLICAPASQAFVERVFSLCGILTAGRRNQMSKSLQMRVLLKLNAHIGLQ